MEWIKELVTEVNGEVIAIDGKAARRSFETKGRRNPLHVVSAWSCQNGIVMGQRKLAALDDDFRAEILLGQDLKCSYPGLFSEFK